MATMHVEVVSPEAYVWSGEATMVLARTVEGDLGILPGHAPLLGQLVETTVTIRTEGADVSVEVKGGFLSVSGERVSVLAEEAVLV